MPKSHARAQEIEAAIAAFRPQVPELEFPIDPAFDSKPPRLNPADAFRLCEEMIQYRDLERDAVRRRDEHIDVEFAL
jgi:hypothetical protein